jgi:hypothetical protein
LRKEARGVRKEIPDTDSVGGTKRRTPYLHPSTQDFRIFFRRQKARLSPTTPLPVHVQLLRTPEFTYLDPLPDPLPLPLAPLHPAPCFFLLYQFF